MPEGRPHIVIIGAGFGGLLTALHLQNANCRVTIIDRLNYHLFQPLLYQVATAGLSPGDIAAPVRHILRKANNIEVLMAEVTGVDVAHRAVHLAQGADIPYDYLILATGARHSYFGHDEWEQYAPGLKSIADATTIRRHILRAYEEAELEHDPAKQAALLTIVIVGGGPTGVEMAGSIAELSRQSMQREFKHFNPGSTRIILAEAGPRILAAFPATLSMKAEKKLRRLGIDVRTSTRVEQIAKERVTMNGNNVETHTIIWAAGVEASPAGKWLNVETDRAGRVPVNAFLELEAHPEIYVIGDTALANDEHGQPLPGLAPVAMQQGMYVAKRIKQLAANKSAQSPFHYHDKGTLATIGRSYAIAHIGRLKVSGFFAWLIWVFVHIMYLIGFRNRAVVLFDWMWAYVTYQRAVRLIVEDKTT